MLGFVEAVLGSCWRFGGPCWGLLEPSWGHVEARWGRLGVILWLSEAILGQEGLPLQKTKENLGFWTRA